MHWRLTLTTAAAVLTHSHTLTGPLTADDIEMTKVPPPDTDSFVGVPPYMKQVSVS